MYGIHLSFPWQVGGSRSHAPYIRVKTAIGITIFMDTEKERHAEPMQLLVESTH
jgi:hypothetical protein